MPASGNDGGSHGRLLALVAADLDPVVAAVARDVGEPVDVVRPAVSLIVRALLEADELTPGARAALRTDGERAARAGLPLPALLDRYLSTGWVLLDAASALVDAGPAVAIAPDAIPRLGAALLRAGDAAAAALSEGFGNVERETAARLAAARGELLDEFLMLPPGDVASLGLLVRRAASLGIDASEPREVVVAAPYVGGDELGRLLDQLARAIVPPPRSGRGASAGPRAAADGSSAVTPRVSPLVGIRHGAIVTVAAGGAGIAARVGGAFRRAAEANWVGVASVAPDGLSGVGSAYLEAAEGLAAAQAGGLRDAVVPAADLLLERALLAGGALTRSAVERELGPLRDAGRASGELIPTLEAFIESGQNVSETARRLGVAPRTVTYRLGRAERLLGRRLEGETWIRLAAALFASRLVGGTETRLRAPAPHLRERDRRH